MLFRMIRKTKVSSDWFGCVLWKEMTRLIIVSGLEMSLISGDGVELR